MMYWGNTNTNKNLRPFRRYYSADGSMEVTATFTNSNFTTPSSVEIITFVDGTAYDAAIVVKNTYTGTATTPTGGLFYLHRDYQGSIVAITNATGSLVEKRLFDPWGAIVKVQDGAGNTLTKLTFFDRGYTGHEHLERVGLINMNGRVYDPALHRFLQADSMVQEPYNTQNYNRYGYCLNNPLKYTDVSGEDFGATFLISIGVALVVYFGDAILSGKPITFKGIATTVVTTAVSAGISYGIGTIASGIGNFTTRATFQAVAHGVTQGGMTALQGGKFWSGFAAGSVSSVMSSLWRGGDSYKKVGDVWAPDFANDFKGIGGAWANSTTGTMFFGSISGGAAAALTGGNFWQGAVSGMIVSGMNHTLHDAFDADYGGGDPKPKKLNAVQKYFDYNDDGKISNFEIGLGVVDLGVTIFDIVSIPSGEGVATHLALKQSAKSLTTKTVVKTGVQATEKNVIKGFTGHAANQAITRGFKTADILKIVKNGTPVKGMGRFGPQMKYTLGGNTVVVNAQGKVVTLFSPALGTAKGLGKGYFKPF